MQIVVTNQHRDRCGGVETYVEGLLSLLTDAGHDVVAVFDRNGTDGRPHIRVPDGVRTLSIESDGLGNTIRAINELKGSAVLANSLDSILFRADVAIELPIACFTHVYNASCITGLRINRKPGLHPCDKAFGLSCLASYFPRRCGGRSPISMISSYRREVRQRSLLTEVDLVVANSAAVADQLAVQGIASATLHPFVGVEPCTVRTSWRRSDSRSLAFLGRFEDYKGGDQLLAALPLIASRLDCPVDLTMAGDGNQRHSWEKRARFVSSMDSRISIRFTGWLGADEVSKVLESSDLIVVPSVWPEPFGLVGLEAARFGLPAAAFAVGGIPEWLVDGVNGHLADPGPCSPDDLGSAIVRCIADLDHFRKLSAGAVERRSAFSAESHVRQLVALLERIC